MSFKFEIFKASTEPRRRQSKPYVHLSPKRSSITLNASAMRALPAKATRILLAWDSENYALGLYPVKDGNDRCPDTVSFYRSKLGLGRMVSKAFFAKCGLNRLEERGVTLPLLLGKDEDGTDVWYAAVPKAKIHADFRDL